MRFRRFTFTGTAGELVGRLDLPVGHPKAYALFAHCFTCTKDIHAARRISARLTQHGFAVLRFDFSGLGESEGDFANAGFRANVADLKAAARAMATEGMAPRLLVGHSLGGAAALHAASEIASVTAVATIGAPFSPDHVLRHFKGALRAVAENGEAEIAIGGRPFRITKTFLEQTLGVEQEERIRHLARALLILHAPRDEIVGIENAEAIYRTARHPKSFVSLDDADHLLRRRRDAYYAGDVIAAWCRRYIPELTEPELKAPFMEDGVHVIVAEAHTGRYQEVISAKGHRMLADEPEEVGGLNHGPDPYGYLLSALGACTAMTLRMYAERKGWPLAHVAVRLKHRKVHAADCADCETKEGMIDDITREIAVSGALDEAQLARLMAIADKCPVHRALTGEVKIRSTRVEG